MENTNKDNINAESNMDSRKEASILFILDKSGSMSNMGSEPVDGLNSFYEDQKKVGKFTTTLVLFNDKTEFVHKNADSTNIPRMQHDEYKPCGMTALYDAIGNSIEYQKTVQPKNVIVVILTDGYENCSKDYNKERIKRIVSSLEKDHGWKFIYLGANQDAFEVAGGIGINTSREYEYTQTGYRDIMRTVSDGVSQVILNDMEKPELKRCGEFFAFKDDTNFDDLCDTIEKNESGV